MYRLDGNVNTPYVVPYGRATMTPARGATAGNRGAAGRPSARARIVEAAVELAREVGAGNLSLDAVARRAGVSKGGLLYHFPSKNRLLEALVAFHLKRSEDMLAAHEARSASGPDSVIRACIDLFEDEADQTGPAAGFLAALAENPGLIAPVREFNRWLVDRIGENSSDQGRALVAYMALQGLRCMPLLDIEILTEEERAVIVAELRRLTGATGVASTC